MVREGCVNHWIERPREGFQHAVRLGFSVSQRPAGDFNPIVLELCPAYKRKDGGSRPFVAKK
jgi:hypothetical protein